MIRYFGECTAQFSLSKTKKGIYFVNALYDPGRELSFDSYTAVMSYSNITETVEYKYKFPTWNSLVHAELENLCQSTFMQENGISSPVEGLGKLLREINALTLQGPISFRDDNRKMRCLRIAPLNDSWT